MTRDDVLRWAREADEYADRQDLDTDFFGGTRTRDQIRDNRFATLVRRAALEEARDMCVRMAGSMNWGAPFLGHQDAVLALTETAEKITALIEKEPT